MKDKFVKFMDWGNKKLHENPINIFLLIVGVFLVVMVFYLCFCLTTL